MSTAMQAGSGGPQPSGLADVIDTILDKGLVIDAYVRVSLVGIEVLAIDARVVIASVDTYLRFADAISRMDTQQPGHPEPRGLGDTIGGIAGGVTEPVAKSKTKGALEGAGETLKGIISDASDKRQASRRGRD